MGNTNTSVRTPPTVSITNPRITGNLSGTTQNALIGADLSLTAGGSPSGGSYSWIFTGSPTTVTGAANQPTLSVRWTQTGTYRATITYTQGGISATSYVDVIVRMPTLTNFTATEVADQVNRDQFCSNLPAGVTYTLGCYQGTDDGIVWSSTAQIPSVAYLTDPAQSGIKFVQAVSAYRKRVRDGNVECFTARSSESNIASGWQLDTIDPFNHAFIHPPRYFSQGNSLTMGDFDGPGAWIEGTFNSVFYSYDAIYISDSFETYVYYFTGTDPAHPIFQQAMSLQGTSSPFARLAWRWGGQVRFDYSITPQTFRLQFTNTAPGPKSADQTSSLASTSSNANTLSYTTCAGTTPTANPIDGSRFYTSQLYLDFLSRNADQSGLNFWRSNITECAFDMNCIAGKRVDVARAFFYSGEFIGTHPDLGGQRGTHAYNQAFVLACYDGFLRRAPNAPPDNNWDGFNFWVGVLDNTNPDASDGKYNNVINAFLHSTEYRSRFGPP